MLDVLETEEYNFDYEDELLFTRDILANQEYISQTFKNYLQWKYDFLEEDKKYSNEELLNEFDIQLGEFEYSAEIVPTAALPIGTKIGTGVVHLSRGARALAFIKGKWAAFKALSRWGKVWAILNVLCWVEMGRWAFIAIRRGIRNSKKVKGNLEKFKDAIDFERGTSLAFSAQYASKIRISVVPKANMDKTINALKGLTTLEGLLLNKTVKSKQEYDRYAKEVASKIRPFTEAYGIMIIPSKKSHTVKVDKKKGLNIPVSATVTEHGYGAELRNYGTVGIHLLKYLNITVGDKVDALAKAQEKAINNVKNASESSKGKTNNNTTGKGSNKQSDKDELLYTIYARELGAKVYCAIAKEGMDQTIYNLGYLCDGLKKAYN